MFSYFSIIRLHNCELSLPLIPKIENSVILPEDWRTDRNTETLSNFATKTGYFLELYGHFFMPIYNAIKMYISYGGMNMGV